MKTMRCLDCYWYKWDFLTGKHTATRSSCGLLAILEQQENTQEK